MRLLLLALLVLITGALHGRGQGLLVLCDDPDLESLLVEELKDMRLVSRSELPVIAREKLLTGEGVSLEGATSVLIVEGQPPDFSARLVEASSGAVIRSFILPPLPIDRASPWLAERIRPYLSEISSSRVPRISLIGLRFDLDSPENRMLERNVNLILAAALQKRDIMVLERWRLHDLVFEKSLGAEESPFWRDARMVDGTLTREGEFYNARVRVRPPSQAQWQRNFRSSSLEALTSEIADALSSESGKKSSVRGEVPDSEPAAFLDEARWLLENGLAREAWQAAETSIALGANGKSVETLRVKAAAMTAYPDDLRASHGQDGGFRHEAFPDEELPMRVAAATEMSLLAADYIAAHRTIERAEWWTLEHPEVLGTYSLYTGLRVLRKAYDSGWAATHAPEVTDLRHALQRQIQRIESRPPGRITSIFWTYLANYAAYWNETPAETLAFYRRVLDPKFDAGLDQWPEVVRAEFAYGTEPHPPILAGVVDPAGSSFGIPSSRLLSWTGGDALRLWNSFLEELGSSNDPLHQSDALTLRWQSTASPEKRLEITDEITKWIDSHFDFMSGELGPAVFAGFLPALRQVNDTKDLAPAQQRLVSFYLRLLKSESPPPPGIIPKIWCVFSDRRANATQDQALELLISIRARALRADLSGSERSELTAAVAALECEFPALFAATPPPDAVSAQGPWIASEHVPEDLRWQVGFHGEAAVWFQDSLWVLDPNSGRIWRINPVTGESEFVKAENPPEANWGSQLLLWNNSFVVTSENGISVLGPDLETWKAINLPSRKYIAGVADGLLWAACGETLNAGRSKDNEGTLLYRIGEDLQPELMASSRRRPTVEPLDSVLNGRPFVIFSGKSGGVVIGSSSQQWTFLDSVTGAPPLELEGEFLGNIRLAGHPEILVRCQQRGGDRNRLVRVERISDEGIEVLLSHPERDPDKKARFPYPESLGDCEATEFSVAWHGSTLAVLAWSSKGSPWGANAAKLFEFRTDGTSEQAVIFDVPEEMKERIRKSRHSPRVFQFPLVDPKGFIATPHGYVITGRGMGGYWFLPKIQGGSIVENLDQPKKRALK